MKINSVNTYSKSPSFGSASDIANKIANSKLAKVTDFQGLNMSLPVLLGVMYLAVLGPRLINAQDKYEKEEILRRDLICMTTLGVGSKTINKVFNIANEATSGLVLSEKVKGYENLPFYKKILHRINPFGGAQNLGSEQLDLLYSDVDKYKNGVGGFCQTIAEKGGNLKKMFSLDKQTKKTMENIVGGAENFAKADNKTILKSVNKAIEENSEHIQTLSTQFKGNNKILTKAKSLNSLFALLSIIILVPALNTVVSLANAKITKNKKQAENIDKNSQAATHTNANLIQFLANTNSASQNKVSVYDIFNKNA